MTKIEQLIQMYAVEVWGDFLLGLEHLIMLTVKNMNGKNVCQETK